jgi:hypothetical protein
LIAPNRIAQGTSILHQTNGTKPPALAFESFPGEAGAIKGYDYYLYVDDLQ